MATINRYVLVSRDNVEQDNEYENYECAKRLAAKQDCAVIERQYEWTDSELVFTPDGSDTWP